jgi:hypothetical protein
MRPKILIAIGVLLAIGVVASLAGGGTEAPGASAQPTTAVVEPSATANEPAAASAEPSLSAEPIPASEPPAVATFDDIELTGRGDKVVRFTIPEDAPAIARISHRGSSNFAVETIDANGTTNELLVNEIGNYGGNHMFDNSAHSVAFKITADGSWRVLVRPISRARAWDPSTPLEGKGADVVRLVPASSGLVSLAIRHRGSSNFAVMAYSGTGTELLVNEIGNYSGEVLLPDGTFFLTVEADGSWTGTTG